MNEQHLQPPEPSTGDECTYCGQELQSGGFYIYIPSTVNYFCSDDCAFKHHAEHGDLDWVVELMLEEGTLQRRVLE